jgi:hypothetical protein
METLIVNQAKTENKQPKLINFHYPSKEPNLGKKLPQAEKFAYLFLVRKIEKLVAQFDKLEQLKNRKNLENLHQALEFSVNMHISQEHRGDGAYLDHILRVVTNTIEILENSKFDLNQVIEIIQASVLHDVVEDRYQKIAQAKEIDNSRATVLEERFFLNEKHLKIEDFQSFFEQNYQYLEQKFGSQVSQMVQLLTKTPEMFFESKETKNANYLTHTLESIDQDSRVLLIKICDLIDNTHDIGDRPKGALKYLPLIEEFLKRLANPKNPIRNLILPEKIDQTVQKLEATKIRGLKGLETEKQKAQQRELAVKLAGGG